jgi:flavin-dependent dehydrogenase
LTNACLVVSRDRVGAAGSAEEWSLAEPAEALRQVLHSDPELSARFANARAAGAPVMLGPMAVDASGAGEPGLLLAGDAAGFIDPMTGDGLRFALMGAELAAAIVTEIFDGSLSIERAHLELADRRRDAFQTKWRFNRALRSLVSSPASVTVAAATATVLPSLFSRMIRYAGDC